jgi:peptidyl-prolyl cis-trans isomerase C
MWSMVAFAASLAFAGPPGEVEAGGRPVATINGVVLTQEMIDVRLRSLEPEQVAQMKATGQYVEVLRSIALGEALYQDAIAKGFHEDPQVKLVIAVEARDILASEYAERAAAAAVTDGAVQARYVAQADRYAQPEYRARHILVDDKAAADAILASLGTGADFAAIAAEKSLDQGSARSGGDLGWFAASMMVEPFAKAVEEGGVGLRPAPVETRFGWHIIEVLDARQSVPLEAVREEIAAELREEAMQTLLTAKDAQLQIEWAVPDRPGEPGEAVAAPTGGSSEKPAKKPKKTK